MRETDLKPIDADTEILEGLVSCDTKRDLIPAVHRQPQFASKLMTYLDIPVDKTKMVDMLAGSVAEELIPDTPTLGDYLAGAMITKSLMGDTKAFEVIRDTCGEKPIDRVEQDTVIRVEMPQDIKEYGE